MRALLVEKDYKPVWNSSLYALNSAELEEKYLKKPVQFQNSLVFSNEQTYYDYPHRTLTGLPNTQDVKRVIEGSAQRGRYSDPCATKQEVKDWFAFLFFFVLNY